MADAIPPPPPPPTASPLDSKGQPHERKKNRRSAQKERLLTGLNCASCGGAVDVREGNTNVRCRYCGTPQAVIGERGIVRLMVLNRLDRGRASDTVRRWLRSGIRKEPALKREARMEEAFLAWFPFVRSRLDVIGWVLGVEKRKRKSGNTTKTVTRPKELAVEREADLTMPAADMAEFGVHRVDLRGDEVLPLDDDLLRSRGMVFRPSKSLEEIGQELRRRAIADAEARHRLDHTTFSWLTSVRRRVALVYYPLWVIRYRFRDKTYQVLVDAEDGSLAYGKAPGNHLWRAFCLVTSCAAAAFVGTTMLQHLDMVFQSEDGLKALGFVGLILAGLIYWGYRQFRHGGIVEEGTGLADGKAHVALGRHLKDVMEKLE